MAGGMLTVYRYNGVNNLVQNGFRTIDTQSLCSAKAINYPRN